ncbi:hypothetical protein C9J41_20615 [Photobacterium sp. GB-50]|uniref:hypothetical protein n=1 Tax=Photobacterium sp. GB-50 TaxID=2022107 RepID=UPI000D16FB52|nr:hypothetical protein [Photobacterium sp. GB-50]PSW70010.1 hypothetical protein C9J41_20615 [Photobacterium sp. GB-50]
MSFDLIIKIVVAFVSMLSLIIAFFNIRFNSRKKLIDEYTVAKAFLEDLDNLKNKFVIEKGYQAVAGSDTFDIDVIKHLLLFPNPSRALRDYRIAHSLFCKNRVNGRLRFKWRFRSLWVRNGMAIFHFLIYWLFAMSVFYCLLSPFYIPDFAEDFFSGLGFDQTKQWIFIVFTLVISLYLVVLSLYKLAVYYSAKRLFEQEKQWLDFK